MFIYEQAVPCSDTFTDTDPGPEKSTEIISFPGLTTQYGTP